ncbi:MAG: hypothetical protein KDA52_10390, partial [Planctomycetaceae bacterium]|nr:hypothetical protein [Planctomycetaceae bacterium]
PGIINRLWRRVQPVVSDPPPVGLNVDWPQKVLLQPETLQGAVDSTIGLYSEPSSEQVWDAQEDVWLLELIFDAIVRTNQSATFIGDAPVRRIDQLYLTGGSGESSVAAQQAAGGGGGGGFGGGGFGGGGGGFDGQRIAEDYENDDDGKGRSRSRSASRVAEDGMGGGGTSTAIGFDIAEEIGPEVPPAGMEAAAASTGGFGGARTSGQRIAEDYDGGGGGVPGGSAAGDIKMFRYVGKPSDVEKAPYQERAFYMSVIVMLPDVPNFLTELASSEWPIRIGRFHVGQNPYRDGSTRTVASSSRRSTAFSNRGRTSGRRVAEDDDDDSTFRSLGSGFGRGLAGGLPSGGGGGGASRVGGFSRLSGTLVLPPTMVGPLDIDPYWFTNPDLVQLDFYGVITMYKPITNATIEKKSDGTTEEESLKEIEEAEAAVEAAENAAPLEDTTETSDPSETPDPGTTEAPAPEDTTDSESADETLDQAEPTTETGEAASSEESPPEEAPADDSNPEQE